MPYLRRTPHYGMEMLEEKQQLPKTWLAREVEIT